MTCNPNWHEIRASLPKGQKVEDRPDLVARVFNMKLGELLDDLFKKQIFGKVVARLHVIEFQHRGLPHAHILVVLKKTFKTPEEIDSVITSELPVEPEVPKEPEDDAASEEKAAYEAAMKRHDRWKLLNSLVVKHMVHGPCGDANPKAPCMQDGKTSNGSCSKHFPKLYANETGCHEDHHIYPTYRRRSPVDGGAVYPRDGR